VGYLSVNLLKCNAEFLSYFNLIYLTGKAVLLYVAAATKLPAQLFLSLFLNHIHLSYL